ncbi:MAG: nuclear transport factor 2 family protein [Nevskia sp.]|nr:nuclear transport factor 2 family protein [Nevskia sp.]
MRFPRRPAAHAAALLLAVASVPVGAATDNATARHLVSMGQQWASAWNAGQIDQAAALYAQDAVFLGADGARVTGQAAIRDLFARTLAVNKPHIALRSLAAERSGNLAYDSGDYRETIVSGGTSRDLQGNYLIVFRKRGERWLIVQQVWTEALAPASPLPGK